MKLEEIIDSSEQVNNKTPNLESPINSNIQPNRISTNNINQNNQSNINNITYLDEETINLIKLIEFN